MKPEDVIIPQPDHPTVLYRYETSAREALNLALPVGNHLAPFADVVRYAFEVVRVTPKGYWIRTGPSPKLKWVSAHTTKRYAHADDREALVALQRRKSAYHRHARRKLEEALQAMNTATMLTLHPDADGIRVMKFGTNGWLE